MFDLRVLSIHSLSQLQSEIEKIGAPPASLNDHLAKGRCRAIKLAHIPPLMARFLLQELVLEGGDAVLPQNLNDLTATQTDILLFGTVYQLRHLAIRVRTQSEHSPSGQSELDLLAEELERALAQGDGLARGSLEVRGTRFEWGKRTYVMGIVNATPDSFSGDGIMASTDQGYIDAAVAQAERQIADGADIVDIGGESTRPGSQPVAADEEYRRVIPVIAALRQRVQAPISIDTYKADIARAALDAGADIVNDVWGLRMDPAMKRLVAERHVPVVIMHNRSRPKDAVQSERLGGRYVGVEYKDLLGDVIAELRNQVELALDAGIAAHNIIVDPGIGFGKTLEQNLELQDRIDELRVLGYPILLGPSRKGFIGFTLDLPPDQRVEGTIAAITVGIARGVDIVRVHDVQANVRAARIADAIVRAKT